MDKEEDSTEGSSSPSIKGTQHTGLLVDETTEVDNGPKASVGSSVGNLTNTILGAGMLGLPFALHSSGLITGFLLCVNQLSFRCLFDDSFLYGEYLWLAFAC